MQVFVGEYYTMITASVQSDVDGIPKKEAAELTSSATPSGLSQTLDDVIEIIRGCVPFSQFEVS